MSAGLVSEGGKTYQLGGVTLEWVRRGDPWEGGEGGQEASGDLMHMVYAQYMPLKESFLDLWINHIDHFSTVRVCIVSWFMITEVIYLYHSFGG